MNLELTLIRDRILEIRGMRVILDVDLAAMYDVETRALKQAVRRNIERFPEDFMFELSMDEFEQLKPQLGNRLDEESAKTGRHAKYLPFAFTELGVGMLSSVLRSTKAIDVNIEIMRAFVLLRHFATGLSELWEKVDAIEFEMGMKFHEVFEAIRALSGGNGGRAIVTGFRLNPKPDPQ